MRINFDRTEAEAILDKAREQVTLAQARKTNVENKLKADLSRTAAKIMHKCAQKLEGTLVAETYEAAAKAYEVSAWAYATGEADLGQAANDLASQAQQAAAEEARSLTEERIRKEERTRKNEPEIELEA